MPAPGNVEAHPLLRFVIAHAVSIYEDLDAFRVVTNSQQSVELLSVPDKSTLEPVSVKSLLIWLDLEALV